MSLREKPGQVWVIHNVPAWVCQKCGEKEYDRDTTERILAVLRQPSRPAVILHVPAYDVAPR
jgi:hypothetical protein